MMQSESVHYPIATTDMQTAETAVSTISPDVPSIDVSAWVDEHGDYLFRYALMRLRDETAAQDAVQEALLAAIQSLGSYSGKASERTWLTSILKHKIYDRFRKAVREVPFDGEVTELSEVDNFFKRTDEWDGHWNNKLQPHNWNMSPEEALQESEFFVVLQECMSKLPERVAAVFSLREMDGVESSEICELLSLSANNFWVIMHRARLALRRCIEVNWFRKAVH